MECFDLLRRMRMKNGKVAAYAVLILATLIPVMVPLSGCSKSTYLTAYLNTETSSTTTAFSNLTASSTTTTSSKPPTSSTTPLSSTVLVKSADGTVSISVPSGWNINDTGLYPGAVIGVANEASSEYLIITKKPKSDVGANSTVNDYMDVVKSVFGAILTSPVWGQTSSVTIGGCQGLSAQLNGVKNSDHSNTVYFVNALASKNYYYNVCAYTTSALADANKTDLQNIIKSFKETD
jgi:hypothetical protein